MLWRATLRDLSERQHAFTWLERRALEREAVLASWLLAAWCKDPPTAAQLLGMSPEASEAAMDAMVDGHDSQRALDAAYATQSARKAP